MFEPSRLDHFTLFEAEVYLALTRRAARFCAEQTAELVQALARGSAQLPRMPFPLLVLQLPEERTRLFLDALAPYYTDRGQVSARSRAEEIAKDGLAVYVYHYPGWPVRAAHAIGTLPFSGGVYDAPAGVSEFELPAAIDGWFGLFTDMLLAGNLPTTRMNTGNCLQLQNLVIDGGMCDVDSVQSIAELTNERDLFAALHYCVKVFTESLAQLLVESDPEAQYVVAGCVWQELARRVLGAKRKIDPRLRAILSSDGLSRLWTLNRLW